MKTENSKIRKTEMSFIISAILLLPMLITLFSGLVLIFAFHQHHHSITEFWGGDRIFWRTRHIAFSIISSGILIYHLRYIIKKFTQVIRFKKIGKSRNKVSALSFWFFFICGLTGYIGWIIGAFSEDLFPRIFFVEIHDKLGLLLFVFALIHIIRKLKPTYKVLGKIVSSKN